MPTLDGLLEGSVVGSFTSIGYTLRSRGWEDELPRMDGKTVLVTGGSSGLGRAAATGMASLGARVVIVGRDRSRLDEAANEIRATTGGDAAGIAADLSSLASVRSLASAVAGEGRLDVLVNNASILPSGHRLTEDGIESTAATNLVGPFLLTNLLIPKMVDGGSGRIVTVSSGGMYTERLDVDRLEMEPDGFRGAVAYARTKRAQVVLTELWAERLDGTGVVAHSMHPGWADTPGVASSLPGFRTVMRPFLRTPAQGADTIVFLAAADEPVHTSGGFWHDRAERPVHRLKRTVADESEAELLWEWLCDRSGWDEPADWPGGGA